MLTFPRATIHVHRREWEDALINRSVMTRTYLPENLHPIRQQLNLSDAPPPYPQGYLPTREEDPPDFAAHREREIIPGIYALWSPATPGVSSTFASSTTASAPSSSPPMLFRR